MLNSHLSAVTWCRQFVTSEPQLTGLHGHCALFQFVLAWNLSSAPFATLSVNDEPDPPCSPLRTSDGTVHSLWLLHQAWHHQCVPWHYISGLNLWCKVKTWGTTTRTCESGGFIVKAEVYHNWQQVYDKHVCKARLSSPWTQCWWNMRSRFTWPSLLQQDAEGIFWSSLQRNHSPGQNLHLLPWSWQARGGANEWEFFFSDYPSVSKRFNSALPRLCYFQDYTCSSLACSNPGMTPFRSAPPPIIKRKQHLNITPQTLYDTITWNHILPLRLPLIFPDVKVLHSWRTGAEPLWVLLTLLLLVRLSALCLTCRSLLDLKHFPSGRTCKN